MSPDAQAAPALPTADDARQSLNACAAAIGADIFERYGPHIGWAELLRILEDRDMRALPVRDRVRRRPAAARRVRSPDRQGRSPAGRLHPVRPSVLHDAIGPGAARWFSTSWSWSITAPSPALTMRRPSARRRWAWTGRSITRLSAGLPMSCPRPPVRSEQRMVCFCQEWKGLV